MKSLRSFAVSNKYVEVSVTNQNIIHHFVSQKVLSLFYVLKYQVKFSLPQIINNNNQCFIVAQMIITIGVIAQM